MVTLGGEPLLVKYVYRSCEITMVDREMVADLIVLDMLEFDVILDIDWLVTCHAILNYHMKMVKFNTLGESSFIVQRE